MLRQFVISVLFKKYTFILIILTLLSFVSSSELAEFCLKDDTECHSIATNKFPRYIFYDVNPPEGFNLRRDVYMRMSIFVRKLSKSGDWHLVLPPWKELYHWQSTDVGEQNLLPWNLFFDIPSMKKFAPVMEMHEFLQEYGSTTIDQIFILQHFKDIGEGGHWEEKFEIGPCRDWNVYRELEDVEKYQGVFWGYPNITASDVSCLSFHGRASLLSKVLKNTTARTVMFDHAEVALHDMFGDAIYWQARRSMRFATILRNLAANFREEYLNSTDEADGTVRPVDWMQEKAHGSATGGPYLCVHLRRKDFLWGRAKHVPSIPGAAKQLSILLTKLKLNTLFVATDAPLEEFEELQHSMPNFTVLHYVPSQIVKETYKDGGVAIIDQIICSHARHFIGTYESTFSFRIQEEREIMGFKVHTTFNRLCGDSESKCKEPSIWRIEY